MKYAQVVLADLAPLLKLEPRLFQARMAVWNAMWEHERPCTNEMAMRALGWNQRGWFSARTALLDAGLIVSVVGGYSCPDAQADLLAWAETQRERVAAKLAKGNGGPNGRKLTATDRSRLQRELERLADLPHQFKHQGSLFDQAPLPKHSPNHGEKGNKFNGSSALAPAREETGQNAPDGPSFGKVSANIHETYAKHSPNPDEFSNEFNGSRSHAGARVEKVKDKREEPPCVPPAEENDDFSIPKRKPGKPIPSGWQPDPANLSDNVREMLAHWPPGEYEREALKFVEDAHSNDRRHRQWDRAFGVWLTKHDGYLHNRRQAYERPSGWRQRS